MNITSSGSYIVMFYDGLKKLVRPTMLKPMTEKEKVQSTEDARTFNCSYKTHGVINNLIAIKNAVEHCR